MAPRVLLVGNFLSASGRAKPVCEELATRLSSNGWKILTVSGKVARLPRLVDMLAMTWRARRRYDIAHVDVYSGPSFVWAEAVCEVLRAARKPFVLTLHGGNLPAFASRWPRRVARLLRSANAVTAPSAFLAEHFRAVRSDIELIPNALDLSLYHFRVRDKPAPNLVWLRSFHFMYNPVLVPTVVAQLKRAHPSVRIMMIGPDKGDGSLEATRDAATRLDVTDRVAIVGGVPKAEVPNWLDRADIFLNTTNVDNAPVSILEAMASGLPLVSTSVGGIPFLVRDAVDGLLVDPNDANAMATAVERVLTEPALAASLSREAHSSACAFDWPAILERWKDLLVSTAGPS